MTVSKTAAWTAAALLALFFSALPLRAHEGHSHGDEAPAPAAASAPRGEAASPAVELVAVAQGDTLTVYIDRFTTNTPIDGATVTVEGPDGPLALAAGPEGTYSAEAAFLARPGHHDLLVTMVADGIAEVLPVTLDIPAGTEAATAPAASITDLRARLAARSPAVLGIAAGSFLLGAVVTGLARRRRVVPAIALAVVGMALVVGTAALAHDGDGHAGDDGSSPKSAGDRAQRLPDGSVFVPKGTQRILAVRTIVGTTDDHRRSVQLPGRIIPDPNASGVVQSSVGGRVSAPEGGFPRLGTRVRKGDVLAYVTPPVQRIDASDMRQRQGELDQQIATVQRRVDRYQRLVGSGTVARVQLDETLDELRGLRDRRAALDIARSEPEALVAPVDGVISETSAVAGQMATPGAMIFQIVDPSRLWVEALSFTPIVADGRPAQARLADGRAIGLTYVGTGLTDRNQTVPVQFAIAGDTSGLRIGEFVTVLAATDKETRGLALPRSSLVRNGSGQDVVYEHTSAERFVERPVRVAPLDGDRVLVAAGIEPGRRIVTQGAELLDQVR